MKIFSKTLSKPAPLTVLVAGAEVVAGPVALCALDAMTESIIDLNGASHLRP